MPRASFGNKNNNITCTYLGGAALGARRGRNVSGTSNWAPSGNTISAANLSRKRAAKRASTTTIARMRSTRSAATLAGAEVGSGCSADRRFAVIAARMLSTASSVSASGLD